MCENINFCTCMNDMSWQKTARANIEMHSIVVLAHPVDYRKID